MLQISQRNIRILKEKSFRNIYHELSDRNLSFLLKSTILSKTRIEKSATYIVYLLNTSLALAMDQFLKTRHTLYLY